MICGALDGGGLGVWVGWLSTSGSVSEVVTGDPKMRSRSLGAVVPFQCLLETLVCGRGVVVPSTLLKRCVMYQTSGPPPGGDCNWIIRLPKV